MCSLPSVPDLGFIWKLKSRTSFRIHSGKTLWSICICIKTFELSPPPPLSFPGSYKMHCCSQTVGFTSSYRLSWAQKTWRLVCLDRPNTLLLTRFISSPLWTDVFLSRMRREKEGKAAQTPAQRGDFCVSLLSEVIYTYTHMRMLHSFFCCWCNTKIMKKLIDWDFIELWQLIIEVFTHTSTLN